MAQHFQIIVVGSGFSGSLMAMIAHQLGFSTALLERGRHPRFVIGESSTPLANLLLEQIADEFNLPFLRSLSKWGTWQKQTPHLPCGLKRGFTFYHHTLGKAFEADPGRDRQLMVGASPHEGVADTHWYRPDFDLYLVQQAQALGVAYMDEIELTGAVEESNAIHLTGRRRGEPLEFSASFVIDASGPRGFLHRALALPEKPPGGMPPTQALFSHFTGVKELPACFHADGQSPPYPPEQAAVHHVFHGGWIWVLKFNNGITSAGVAATDSLAQQLELPAGESAWNRILKLLPSLAEIFGPAKAVAPFIHQPRVAFQSAVVAGRCWTLLPSAAGAIDPLLSTGFPLTLLGVVRLARALKAFDRPTEWAQILRDYARSTTLELEVTARLVGTLYSCMNRFEIFKKLSLLYFAAASFSESARRLGKEHLADSFLLCRHPVFSAQLREFCQAAHQSLSASETVELSRRICEAIEPFDVAGLNDTARDPWYPALTRDLFANGSKLQASNAEIRTMLDKCGLA
jgi:tetracycline 7-halogenase / FADH2 O2-dependent halogenase